METNNIAPNTQHNGRVMAGIILLAIGSMLFIRQMDWFFFPHWLFSWPMWLIAIGVYIGAKHNFTKPAWLWLVVLGTAFLVTHNVHDGGRIVWPAAVMALGVWMVTRHNNKAANGGQPNKNYTDYTEVK
jgi:hypothetical protein